MAGESTIRDAIRAQPENLKLGGYADDIHILSKEEEQIYRAHTISLCWSHACGAAFNPKKSIALGNIELHISNKMISMASKFKMVGRVLSIHGDLLEMPEERCIEMSRRLKNLSRIPGSRSDRLEIAATWSFQSSLARKPPIRTKRNWATSRGSKEMKYGAPREQENQRRTISAQRSSLHSAAKDTWLTHVSSKTIGQSTYG